MATGIWLLEVTLESAKIFTTNVIPLYVQAVAITGNKILAVGSDAAINALATTKTRKMDLQG